MTITYKSRSWYNILFGWHLAYIWTGINTLIGLLVWLIIAGRKGLDSRISHPGLILLGISPTSILGRHFAHRGLIAITFGHTILILDIQPQTLGHELVHVRQYEALGPLFLPFYGLASLIAWLLHKNPYLANPFERQAYHLQNAWQTRFIY